jgi:nucleoside-diphosphate-sugar epimerase
MRVFLTGATGYIGTAVAEHLRAAGHQVMGLARSDAAAGRLRAAGVEAVRGDFTDPAGVGATARAADGTISMATAYDLAVDPPAVDAILHALEGSGKPFIYTSGIWSHGDTGGHVVDETTPPRPLPMVQWRQAVEDRVLAAAGRNIRTIVIRPAIVYGRSGGIPGGFVESARSEGAARMVGKGENRWPLVFVDDLADLYLRALEQAPPGTLLLGVSGPAVRVRDLATAASRGAGANGRVFAWPLDEARAELGEYADALALDDLERGSYVPRARRAVS